jgi:hypothetical protein
MTLTVPYEVMRLRSWEEFLYARVQIPVKIPARIKSRRLNRWIDVRPVEFAMREALVALRAHLVTAEIDGPATFFGVMPASSRHVLRGGCRAVRAHGGGEGFSADGHLGLKGAVKGCDE